jgi:hypothetical protein
MGFRDDRDAAFARAEALARELETTKAELEARDQRVDELEEALEQRAEAQPPDPFNDNDGLIDLKALAARGALDETSASEGDEEPKAASGVAGTICLILGVGTLLVTLGALPDYLVEIARHKGQLYVEVSPALGDAFEWYAYLWNGLLLVLSLALALLGIGLMSTKRWVLTAVQVWCAVALTAVTAGGLSELLLFGASILDLWGTITFATFPAGLLAYTVLKKRRLACVS